MTEQDYSFDPIEFDPFAGPEIEKVVPAIEPQTEIWSSCQLGGEDANRSYNESVSLELSGNLHLPSLKQALASVTQRHESLRSGFSADGTQLCIYTDAPPPFDYTDISGQSIAQQKEIIARFLVKDASTPFNIQTGPLFRVNLFKQTDALHHLTLSAHHIICDGWSIGVVMQDIARVYSALVRNESPDLEPAPSFAEYALKQRLFHSTKEYQQIENYWLNQYKHDIPILDLATDHVRPEIRTYKSSRDDYTLDPGLVNAIRKLGASAGCSFVTTMIVAFEVFLYKISGQEDIILGVPSAGQSADDLAGLVGHCVNTLPVRSRHSGGMSFQDTLKQRKTAIFDAYENQQFTFGSLLKKMNISRDTSRIPLVPVVFNIDIGLDEGVKFHGLEHTLSINKREYENFEMFLNASGTGNSLTLEWSYNTQLFEAATISRMMKDLESLLYTVTGNPDILLKEIPVQTSERVHRPDRQIKIHGHLVDPAAIEHWLNIQDDIEESLVISREDIPGEARLVAYVTSDSSPGSASPPSWQERWEDLYQRGAQAESSLGISEQKLDTAVAQQLSGRDDIGEEVDEWLEQSANRIKMLPARNAMELGCGAGQLVFKIAPYAKHFVATDYSSTAIEKLNEKIAAEPSRFGNVKTVVAPADDFSSVAAQSLDLVIINGVVQYFPDAEYLLKVIHESSKAIRNGGCIYIGDMQGKSTLPMYHAFDQINRTDGQQQAADFKKIVERRIRVEDELLADPAFFYLIPGVVPAISGVNIQLREGKHINETTKYHYDIWLYVNAEPKAIDKGLIIPWQPGSGLDEIARLLDNSSGKVLSVEHVYNSRTAADHRLQEILRNSDDHTSVNAIKQAMAHIREGLNPDSLWKLGTAKGFNAHIRWTTDGADGLFDVTFIPQHLGNKIPMPPVPADGASKNLYDYSRNPLSENISATGEQSRAWKDSLSKELPYYMIPTEFVILQKMPLLPDGTIDKDALPRPEAAAGETETSRPPQTEMELLVAKVWAEVLRIESLGLDDDFFELGGHSLLAVQVMIRLEKETGIRLPLTRLFKFSTLEQFAQLFSQNK